MNTKEVAHQFSNAARTYDAWAKPQTRVAKSLCSFLPQHAEQIVDLGCGTGIMTHFLRERFPTASIIGVDPAEGMVEQYLLRFSNDSSISGIVASAEAFCANVQCDLIVSTNSFHWFSNKKKALANITQSLSPSGVFVIATPLERTLWELYASYFAATGAQIQYAELLTEADHAALFAQAGLCQKTQLVEEFQVESPEPQDIFDFLRNIGGAPPQINDAALHSDQKGRLIEYYRTHFSTSHGVRATYHYLYGVYSRLP